MAGLYPAMRGPPQHAELNWSSDHHSVDYYDDWITRVTTHIMELSNSALNNLYQLLLQGYAYKATDSALTNKLFNLLSNWITGGRGLQFLAEHRIGHVLPGQAGGRGDLVWKAFTAHFHKKYSAARTTAAQRFIGDPNCADLTTEGMFNKLYSVKSLLVTHGGQPLDEDFDFILINRIWATDFDSALRTPTDIDAHLRRSIAFKLREIDAIEDEEVALEHRVEFNFSHLADLIAEARLDGGIDSIHPPTVHQVHAHVQSNLKPHQACWYYNHDKDCPRKGHCKFAHTKIANRDEIPLPRSAATLRNKSTPTNAAKSSRRQSHNSQHDKRSDSRADRRSDRSDRSDSRPDRRSDRSDRPDSRSDRRSDSRSSKNREGRPNKSTEICHKFLNNECTTGQYDCPHNRRHVLSQHEVVATLKSAHKLFNDQPATPSIQSLDAHHEQRTARTTITPTQAAAAAAAPASTPRRSYASFLGFTKALMLCTLLTTSSLFGPAYSSDISGDGPTATACANRSYSLSAAPTTTPDAEVPTHFDHKTNRLVTFVRKYGHLNVIRDHDGNECYRDPSELSAPIHPSHATTMAPDELQRDDSLTDEDISDSEFDNPVILSTVTDTSDNVMVVDIDGNELDSPQGHDIIEQLYHTSYMGDDLAESSDAFDTTTATTPDPAESSDAFDATTSTTSDLAHSTADCTIAMMQHLVPPRHIMADSGAGFTVCPHVELIHNPTPVYNMSLGDAGSTSHGQYHSVTYSGHLRLQLDNDADNQPFELRVPCLVVPTIQSTLLNTTYLWKELGWSAVTNAGIGTTWYSANKQFSHTLQTIGSQEYFRVTCIPPDQARDQTIMLAGDDIIRAQQTTTPPTTLDSQAKRKSKADHDITNAQRPRLDKTSKRGGATTASRTDPRYDLGDDAYDNEPVSGPAGATTDHSDSDIQLDPTLIPTTPGSRKPLPVPPTFATRIRIAPVPELLDQLRSKKLNRNEADWVRCQLARQHIITTSGPDDKFLQLHHRLGHINARDTLAIARKYNLDIGKYAGIACDACFMAKSKRHSVTKTPTSKAHYPPLSAWCLDFYGPTATPSTFGKTKYLLAAIDKSTRKGIIIPLASLSQQAVLLALEEFVAQVQQFAVHGSGPEISIDLGPNIQTDSAPVFISRLSQQTFKKAGFSVFYASPGYTQAKNGLVERFLGAITASAKAMLYATGLAFGFFPEACMHAALIHNVTPHASLGGLSPEEFLTGTAPNIDLIKPFGATVWIHQHVRTNKEAPKGLPGIYLGVDRLSQSHWVYYRTPTTGRPVRLASYHVTFDNRLPPNVLNDSVPTIRDELSFSDPPPLTTNLVCQLAHGSTFRHDDDTFEVFLGALDGKIYYNERGALNSPDGHHFKTSLRDELDGLMEMGAIRPIDPAELTDQELQGATPCMTLFYMKRDTLGIEKGKMRLTYKGSNQVRGLDYTLKSNHTPRWTTIRAHFGVQPLDPVNTVVMQSDIKKFFCQCDNETPDGHRVIAKLPIHARIHQDGRTYEYIVLDKALYGQVNSGYLAETMLWNYLRESGWTQCYDPTTWRRGASRLLIWVDDIVTRGPEPEVQTFLAELDARFPGIKANPCTHFLGHDVTRDPMTGLISISAATFISDVMTKHNITHTKDTPLTPGIHPHKIQGEPDPSITTEYRSIIGTLCYLATSIRADLAYAASALGQCAANPNKGQLEAAKHALRYLNGTASLGIQFAHADDASRNQFECYVDASYADAPGFRSQTGCVILCNNAPISFFSRTQKLVTTSSQESEIVAATDAAKEVFFLRELMESWHCDAWPTRQRSATICHEDNQGAISWLENGCLGDRTKHYGIRFSYLREQMNRKVIQWQYINTSRQIADALTKSLGTKAQRLHFDKLLTVVYKRLVSSIMVTPSQQRATLDDNRTGRNGLMFTSRSW